MKINKKNMKVRILAEISIMLVILLGSYVSAFSLGCLYHKDNPLRISPGQTADIPVSLQASTGGDLTVVGKILEGEEVMTFTDPSSAYLIPAGGEIKSNLRVSIPSNAAVGQVYSLKIGFSTESESAPGSFGFGSSIVRSFNAIVIPAVEQELPEEKMDYSIILLIAAIIIVIIVIIILTRRKKKRKK
jgi:hypothetical protein